MHATMLNLSRAWRRRGLAVVKAREELPPSSYGVVSHGAVVPFQRFEFRFPSFCHCGWMGTGRCVG